MFPVAVPSLFNPAPSRSRQNMACRPSRPPSQTPLPVLLSPLDIPPPLIGFDSTSPRCSVSKETESPRLPRLLSPIRIPERRARLQSPVSPTPHSSSTKKRRSGYATRSSGRTRHCRLTECDFRGGPAVFDQIPWISMLDATPAADSYNPFDLPDLSDLPCEKPPRLGPIRSRKSSLHSASYSPELPPVGTSTPELIHSTVLDSPLTELPYSLDSPRLSDDDVLKTPPMRATELPVNIGFHHLMPVAFADVHADESWWPRGEPGSP